MPATPPPLELRGKTVRYMYTSVGKVGELEKKRKMVGCVKSRSGEFGKCWHGQTKELKVGNS